MGEQRSTSPDRPLALACAAERVPVSTDRPPVAALARWSLIAASMRTVPAQPR